MENLVVFLDYANIDRTAKDQGQQLDYGHLLGYLSEGRCLREAFCYVPIDLRAPHACDAEIEDLWGDGYLVQSKSGTIVGDSYQCNIAVEMTLDMMRVAQEVAPDIVVLASGDGDFLPVVLALRKRGIRAEVAGFRDNTASDMVLQSSGFIDLDDYCQQLEDNEFASQADDLEESDEEDEAEPLPESQTSTTYTDNVLDRQLSCDDDYNA